MVPVATDSGEIIGRGDGTEPVFVQTVGARRAPWVRVIFDAKSTALVGPVRGEGAILRDLSRRAFMKDFHPLGDLAPRDIVARAIDSVMKRDGSPNVLLDATQAAGGHLRERFPHIYETCRKAGFDLAQEPIPVVPAAHYLCGGVATDLAGRTSLAGLFAVGEVACTGLHGANRLASNSLMECLVFARRLRDIKLGPDTAAPADNPSSCRSLSGLSAPQIGRAHV